MLSCQKGDLPCCLRWSGVLLDPHQTNHVTVSFQSPAVPGCHPVCTIGGRMQGQHPHHCKCSPGARQELGLPSAADLVWLSPSHPLVGWCCGIVGLSFQRVTCITCCRNWWECAQLPLCNVGAGKTGMNSRQHYPPLCLPTTAPWLPISRKLQMLSESLLALFLAMLLQESIFSSCFSPSKWLFCHESELT